MKAKLSVVYFISKKEDWSCIFCKKIESTPETKEEFISIVGDFKERDLIAKGSCVEVEGIERHYNDNLQINVKSIRILNLDTTFSLEKFISDNIKGIGKKGAKKITAITGNTLNDVLKILKDPSILNSTDLKESKKKLLLKKLKQDFEEDKLMKELLPLGIKKESIERLKKHPEWFKDLQNTDLYKTIKFYEPKISLKEIDILVMKYQSIEQMGLSHLKAYIINFMQYDYYMNKNIYCPYEKFFKSINNHIFQNSIIKKNYTTEEIKEAIDNMNSLVIKGDRIYLYSVDYILKKIIRMIHEKIEKPKEEDTKALELFLNNSKLGEDQKKAVILAYENPLSIISGRAGTGKTTLLKTLCDFLRKNNKTFELCSYTGKAASVLTNKTNYQASTIHRLFKIMPKNEDSESKESYFESRPTIDTNYLIIDEAGLLGMYLIKEIFSFITPSTKVILIGDDCQLLPINPGLIFHNLLKINGIPKIQLTKIYRQGENSGIIKNASYVLDDKPLDPDSSFEVLETKNINNKLEDLIKNKEMLETQIISGYNKTDYDNGSKNINKKIQKIKTIGNPFKSFRLNVGDKIINTKNNYNLGIFNGDMGYIEEIEVKGHNQTLVCNFNKKRARISEKEERDAVDLGYAISVHKAQGSEWDEVIVIADMQQIRMINKNWFYTAITRGSKKVTVITDNVSRLQEKIKFSQGEDIKDDFIERFLNYNNPEGEEKQKEDEELSPLDDIDLISMFGAGIHDNN